MVIDYAVADYNYVLSLLSFIQTQSIQFSFEYAVV